MNIVLTQFAIDRHFGPDSAGTVITDRTPEQFEKEVHEHRVVIQQGYAPFCKLVFIKNWTDAKAGTLPIASDFLKSAYSARKEGELPILIRWLELPAEKIPRAKYLCLVLYNKEQLAKEETDIGDADWGIVAVLGQMHDKEEPINPATMLRNALGVKEGGSGVSIDREAYRRSVEFWNTHAAVKWWSE